MTFDSIDRRWTIRFVGPGADGPETTELVGWFDTPEEATAESVRLLAHLDQRIDDKITADVVPLKSVGELELEWT